MMSERQQRWREISEYLDKVLDVDEADRETWLAALDQRLPVIAASVRSLLAERAALAGSSLLDTDVLAGLSRASLAGQRLGAYTLESILGHGGMGTVWLARRSDGRFEGSAAVKLLNAALLGRPAEQRFVQEGSVLASLRHPNIAQLIDAGVAPGGQPYLVLEYVDGERIDGYAERHGLGLEARVRLFLDVLAAVAHAHSHLVVHRDLKPANIFVTSDGLVKLLDFGVAALLGTSKSDLTREGGIAMTPEYAAPEQLLGNAVTTATDVYALGLVLFVLLVGRHPLAPEGKSVPELARSTLETDPPRASELAQDLRRERALRGDLDNIVAKALKKLPEDRYRSAELLAQDLRRYLAHEPVSARPDKLAYRAAKFVRRHRGGVLTGGITALALIAAVAITTAQMIEARHQRDAAVFQSKRAEYQARFAYQIMSELGSDDHPITIRELMQKGVEVLERNYGDDPRFVIAALINISGRYMDLGDTQGEYGALVKAEKLARKLEDPQEIASVQCNTVETELQAGRPQQAAERMRDGVANLARVANPSVNDRIACEMAQARLQWSQGDSASAIPTARTVAAFMEANHLEGDFRYNTVVTMLEIMLGEAGNAREALQWNRRGIAALEKTGRAQTVSMVGVRHNQAVELYECGDVRGAYEQEKRVVDDVVGHQGATAVPPSVAQRMGFLQVRIEETDAGLAWIERALRDSAAQSNRTVQVSALLSRARANFLLGNRSGIARDIDLAEKLAREKGSDSALPLQLARQIRAQLALSEGNGAVALAASDEILRQVGYPSKRSNLYLPALLTLRAQAESMLGRAAQALTTAREALAVSEERALSPDHSADVGAALMALAMAQRAMGEETEARSSAQRAVAALSASLGRNHSETRAARAFAG